MQDSKFEFRTHAAVSFLYFPLHYKNYIELSKAEKYCKIPIFKYTPSIGVSLHNF